MPVTIRQQQAVRRLLTRVAAGLDDAQLLPAPDCHILTAVCAMVDASFGLNADAYVFPAPEHFVPHVRAELCRAELATSAGGRLRLCPYPDQPGAGYRVRHRSVHDRARQSREYRLVRYLADWLPLHAPERLELYAWAWCMQAPRPRSAVELELLAASKSLNPHPSRPLAGPVVTTALAIARRHLNAWARLAPPPARPAQPHRRPHAS